MAKAKPPIIELPDVLELLEKLAAGNVPMAIDPVTAAFNFGTAALLLIGKIIDTVPEAQHAENWARIDKIFDVLKPGGN